MIVREFLATDLLLIALQPHQRSIEPQAATLEYGTHLAAAGPSFTVSDGAQIVACIGLIRQWEGCSRAYALLGESAGRYMAPITKKVQRFLNGCGERRIEAAVESSFDAGHRWVRMMGFVHEGRMTKYWNDRDADLYARVRE